MKELFKNMHSMKLGEERELGTCGLFRVPGGWIITFQNGSSSVFIPYSDEFK